MTRPNPTMTPDAASETKLIEAVEHELRRAVGELPTPLSPEDVFFAVSRATRGTILERMHETEQRFRAAGAKRVHYLSAEFLIGRSLENNLVNLGVLAPVRRALEELGADLETAFRSERDAALGSGGLGRLAACFVDSLASLDMPGYGYGLNYEHGLFRQEIRGGEQVEHPDSWRINGSPWVIDRRAKVREVPLYGRVDARLEPDAPGGWREFKVIQGVPGDLPVVGWGGRTVTFLRLYRARAVGGFDLGTFQEGRHLEAFAEQVFGEKPTKVLYPAEATEAGRELRLVQELFFASCAIQDILDRHLEEFGTLASLVDKVAIQLNDTHPALAIAELMRLLVDEHGLSFDDALATCRGTFAYTNHTLLPEALERWPRPLLARVAPRHLRAIERINAAFLNEVVARWPDDLDRMRRMSIIEEGYPKLVRMAHLAIVGSRKVNGVSELHSDLMRKDLVPDFAELWPERFGNQTNGVSPRRWLVTANPGLAELVTSRLGDGWITDLERLRELEAHVDDTGFLDAYAAVKAANKERLAAHVGRLVGVAVDPTSMYDVQIKRIHEYKRQLLCALYTIHLYLRIVEDGHRPASARTMLFAGKAAPDYWLAKQIIRFLWHVSRTIDGDTRVDGALRAAFLPDYRVSLAERIVPAADLSEQISTAGMEASGTGNMKLALNGALTMGTLDGANIEIREAVGAENVYTFGLRAEQIGALRAPGRYDPRAYYEGSPALKRALDAVAEDRFSPEKGAFRPIVDTLLAHGDPFFVLADFDDYVRAQEEADRDFADRRAWTRRAALNTARMGRFSSDRTIRGYASEIWGVGPVR